MFVSEHRAYRVVVVAAVMALSWVSLAGAQTVETPYTKVAVVNQPNVSVPQPIPHAQLVKFEAVSVSGAGGGSGRLLSTAGFSHVMLSLAVEVQGASPDGGAVTATLIPNVEFIKEAFENDGIALFPIQTAVSVGASQQSIFGSQPVRFPLSFPEYRVYFSNASDLPAKAYLYVNLTN